MAFVRAAARCLVLLLALAAPHIASAQAENPELKQLRVLVESGELERASSAVDAYVQAHPKDPRARFLKAVILTHQNRIDDAIAIYTQLTYDYPELPEPYNNLAALYAQQGRYDAARDALQRAIDAQPSYATAHENLGDIYARLAARSYARALELDAGRAEAQRKLKIVNDLVPPAPPSGKP